MSALAAWLLALAMGTARADTVAANTVATDTAAADTIAADTVAADTHFETLDVYVDPEGRALAAYQLEVVDVSGNARVVGIEGGEHPAFEKPPYYDPEAIEREAVVLAAFHVGDDVPSHETRVATIHYAVATGTEPEFEVHLQVAASPSGHEVPALVRISQGEETE